MREWWLETIETRLPVELRGVVESLAV
jgi:hypothetical protein